MGAAQSSFDPRHVRIWNILSSIESTNARISQLETLFSAQEYVAAAKKAGLYGTLLQWMAAQRRGEYYPWPVAGNANAANTPALAQRPMLSLLFHHRNVPWTLYMMPIMSLGSMIAKR
jgi:hypothetical protein